MMNRSQLATISLVGVDADDLMASVGPDPMLAVLSKDEQVRADRYRTGELRNRFIAGRFTLRQMLGEAIGIPAEAIKFVTGGNGKPAITDSQSNGWHFSFSRSDRYAIIAFACGCRVGVDVESVKQIPDMDLVATEIFGAPQLQHWQALEPSERMLAFYRGWTRKEAISKLDGRGISAGVLDIEVPITRFDRGCCEIVRPPDIENAGLQQTRSSVAILSEWNPFSDFQISLAIEFYCRNNQQIVFHDTARGHCAGLIARLGLMASACVVQRIFEVKEAMPST